MLTDNLIKELNKALPKENILSDEAERYVYSFDASNNQQNKALPDAVVFVENIEQVLKVVKIANEQMTPIICRGAGTNTVGACVPTHGGIVLNFSKMNKILEINPENMTARVQPGVVVGDLQKAVEKQGLFYPPDPSNLKISTIGGSIAQNSAGARCFKYGATKDYIIDMLVVMANGELIRTGSNTIKNATGYNLGSIFIGSEGTLGIVVEATIKLIPKPEETQVIMAYFDTVEDSIYAVNKIIEKQVFPATIDFMDKNAIQTVEKFYPTGLLCDKESALIIELDGYNTEISRQRETICEILRTNNAANIQYSRTKEEAEHIWAARRSSMAACTKLKPNVTTDDIIVPRSNLAKLVKGVQDICTRHNLTVCLVGHVGDGSVHPQIPIDYNNKDEYKHYKIAKSEIYQLTARLGGIISGEHGIGLEKKAYISQVVDGGALGYMRQIKKIFDPKNILNPYKIF
ncbi:MAG TPA: glycolate oxidase subunit GlcD [Cyanobacteria bacterium UBA10660]|jgi:glycolate oxidase|nr:MAG TPA: glycolate oxidase subunit GlcD [Candidatus Gastranaerophilales bacterium HUM_1]HAS93475.1 glycolate oxidase subunit GlcD [Cyanobacteria bacterium UBA10660]